MAMRRNPVVMRRESCNDGQLASVACLGGIGSLDYCSGVPHRGRGVSDARTTTNQEVRRSWTYRLVIIIAADLSVYLACLCGYSVCVRLCVRGN